MINTKTLTRAFLFLAVPLLSFERLENKYLISYGEPNAKIEAYKYFSFSCPNCLDFIVEDFKSVKQTYLTNESVYWVFHPDPSDKLTLQALICLEKLDNREKGLFLEAVSKLIKEQGFEKGSLIMQLTMEAFGKPIKELESVQFLKASSALQNAYQYLKQEGIITSVPTLEINSIIYDEYPSLKFIESKLNSLIQAEKNK